MGRVRRLSGVFAVSRAEVLSAHAARGSEMGRREPYAEVKTQKCAKHARNVFFFVRKSVHSILLIQNRFGANVGNHGKRPKIRVAYQHGALPLLPRKLVINRKLFNFFFFKYKFHLLNVIDLI